MQKNKIYKIVGLSLFALMLSACTATSTSSFTKTANLRKTLNVKSKKMYHENEPVKFEINTGTSKGYLSLVYLDEQGRTKVLYANKSIAMEKSRDTTLEKKKKVFSFPEDFDDIVLLAKKDCQKCEKEKTKIFFIFSDDPIDNLEEITKSELLSLNLNSTQVKNRSILGNANVLMRKVEFFVR